MWLSSFYFQPQTTALYWAERALKLSLACRDYTYKNQLDLTQSQQKFRLKYIQYIGVTYIHGSHFNSFLHEWKVSNVENSLNIPPKFQTCYTQKGMAYESETTKVWEIGAMYVNTVIVSTYLGTRYMGCTLVPLQCNATWQCCCLVLFRCVILSKMKSEPTQKHLFRISKNSGDEKLIRNKTF